MLMKPYRDIGSLAGLQVVCFLLLTHLEPHFFLLHLYQSILYVGILVLLFYMEDHWAYMTSAWVGLGRLARHGLRGRNTGRVRAAPCPTEQLHLGLSAASVWWSCGDRCRSLCWMIRHSCARTLDEGAPRQVSLSFFAEKAQRRNSCNCNE